MPFAGGEVNQAQREARREFLVNPVEDSPSGGLLLLSNGGRATYKEFQVTARYKLRETDQLVASYTRSKSEGNLNDFNGFYGNFQNPVIRPDERGPLPWDAPHRFLVWGDLGVKYGITVAPVSTSAAASPSRTRTRTGTSSGRATAPAASPPSARSTCKS